MRRAWTSGERAYLAEHYPNQRTREIAADLGRTESSVHQAARKMGLSKTQEAIAEMSREAGRNRTEGQFPKGNKPWNKGRRWVAGGRSAQTRFRKGNKPQTWKPIGTERVNPDGILERKVADNRDKSDWRPVHVLKWERYRGPVPEGKFLVFKDGNHRNMKIDNLLLVDRAENMRRNSHYNRYPREISLAIQAVGALNRQINRRAK